MKTIKLIGLFLAFGVLFTNVQAQKTIDGKPTYKETTDFIKTYFAHSFFTDGKMFEWGYDVSEDGRRNYLGHYHKITVIEFTDSCQAKFEYEIKKEDVRGDWTTSTQTIKRSIDFSKVESISIQGYGRKFMIYGMMFNVKNSPKQDKDEVDLPFTRRESEDDNYKTLEEAKIYKAFNHLRKLCGAPDPIEF